jgi:hypothetical protein
MNKQQATEEGLHYRDNTPNEDWALNYEDTHSLTEFVEGYENARKKGHPYESEDQVELMDDFLKIAKKDIDGSYEYKAEGCERVIEALTTFGL